MELYKTLNNEALDEDLKAKREVMERIKKNVRQIDEEVLSKVEISKENKTLLIKAILSLNASIDDIFLKSADTRIKEKYNLGDIPYKYNLLATYIIRNLKYRNLEQVDKSYVNENVDKLIPKLQSLEELANKHNFLDAFLVPKIIDNIKFRQFNTLIDLPEIQEKISKFTTLDRKKKAEPKLPEVLKVPNVKQKGRPRKYATPEEAYKAKLESTKASKLRKKEASQVLTPAQAEVEAQEPKEGDIQEDLDEEDEDEAVLDMLVEQYNEKLEDYENEPDKLTKKKLLKEVKHLENQIEAIDPEYFN